MVWVPQTLGAIAAREIKIPGTMAAQKKTNGDGLNKNFEIQAAKTPGNRLIKELDNTRGRLNEDCKTMPRGRRFDFLFLPSGTTAGENPVNVTNEPVDGKKNGGGGG